MAHCINIAHHEVQSLSNYMGVHPAIAAAKIAVWQEETGIMERFPDYEEVMGIEDAYKLNKYQPKIREVGDEELNDLINKCKV